MTLECPSPIGCASISPAPRSCSSRKARRGSSTSSGGRPSGATSAWRSTMSSGATAALIGSHATPKGGSRAVARPRSWSSADERRADPDGRKSERRPQHCSGQRVLSPQCPTFQHSSPNESRRYPNESGHPAGFCLPATAFGALACCAHGGKRIALRRRCSSRPRAIWSR